ncbi:Fc receptor-like protein 5 [Lampris incognitus]|uniref:Fc receptor-like protein 5 n=1 Tax=Lampris incognitus TaxID=2546036 RepID=UPI0024B4C052|nr:Fc receptor-like protein 5 [Lampris incognitus]
MCFLVAVIVLGLPYCAKEACASPLGDPLLDGPDVALVGAIESFNCQVLTYPKDEPILLQLFKKGDRSNLLAEYTSIAGGIGALPLIVEASHDGDLECVASVQNSSAISANITVSKPHHFKVIEPVTGVEVAVSSGSTELYEGTKLELRCGVTHGTHVTYRWSVNGQPVTPSLFPLQADDKLFIINRTTPQDSGQYICVAINQFNETMVYIAHSEALLIMVKEVVSNPDISFTVLKRDSQNVSAVVNCQSARGTPPITFLLYNSTELVSSMTVEEQDANFTVPVVLDQHMGCFQCHAENGDRTAYSRLIPLEVVTVGGPVTMRYDYDVGENFAVVSLMLHCKAAKGSHLQYQWFMNTTLLEKQGTFYRVFHHRPTGESRLQLSVGRSSAGTYHCEVSDSFDSTTVIKSVKWHLDEDALNRLPDSVVAVVFGCFFFLVAFVSGCCCVGLVHRRKRYGEISQRYLDMKSMVVAYEDELDLGEYEENIDAVREAIIDDSDQVSIASADEWSPFGELEDHPGEF